GAQELLGRHRGQVAPEHGGRPDLRLAEGDHGQVEGNPTRLPHAVADATSNIVQVAVARGQIGRGVGDGDLRSALEGVSGYAAAHPGSMDVRVAVVTRIPLVASQSGHPRFPSLAFSAASWTLPGM